VKLFKIAIKSTLYKNLKALRKAVVVTSFALPLLMIQSVSALNINSTRDRCNDGNSVINCGALSVNELQRKYNNDTNARAIYNNFGISRSDINAMDTTATSGTVTSGGRVIVKGKVVANNAMTAGLANMRGSQTMTANGVTFYKRPPSVSFQQSSLPAFVVMKNGQFDFAIIASCGNPVTATAVVKPRQTSPPAAAVRPPAVPRVQRQAQTQTQTQTQSQAQSQTVVVNRTVAVAVPAATPTPAPAPQPQPKQIPNTGVGDIAGFGSFVTLFSAGAHFLYKRKLSA
jgi:hypothetical protein